MTGRHSAAPNFGWLPTRRARSGRGGPPTTDKGNRPAKFEERDQLASPLTVKALPLANGGFVPSTPPVNGVYPEGRVFLGDISKWAASFDCLVARAAAAQSRPLRASRAYVRRSWTGCTRADRYLPEFTVQWDETARRCTQVESRPGP